MNIVYSSTKLLNIKLLTVVNGNACYEIEVKDKAWCKHKFVCTLQSTKFIAMIHDGNLHVFNLMQDQDGIFPKDLIRYIDENRKHLIKILNLSGMLEKIDALEEFNKNNPHNLAIIEPNSPPGDQFLDLNVAKGIIRALNIKLQETCPGFYLHIDYLTSFPTGSTVSIFSPWSLHYFMRPPLLLCLMHGNECVSSITMDVCDGLTIRIDSKTNELYENRKFNTLLRAVAIIISKGLSESAEQLTSDAANIISALLMIKRFNAVSLEGDISKFTISPEKLDKVIKDYFHQHDDRMKTMVELNEENIANATTVFHETIPRMNCKPLDLRSFSVRRRKSASPSRRKTRSASPSPSRRKTTPVRSASLSRRKTTPVRSASPSRRKTTPRRVEHRAA